MLRPNIVQTLWWLEGFSCSFFFTASVLVTFLLAEIWLKNAVGGGGVNPKAMCYCMGHRHYSWWSIVAKRLSCGSEVLGLNLAYTMSSLGSLRRHLHGTFTMSTLLC